jgi:hypothetical protein
MSFVDIRRWLVRFQEQLEDERCPVAVERVDLAIKLLDDAQKLGIENRARVLKR